jgi:DNA-binding cell septation regulator SpoVG
MEIRTLWQDSTYPQFNLELASVEGAEAFLVVKGCRIVSGQKGDFVSGPATKGNTGKYWNHTYFGDKFSAAVLAKALATQPSAKPAQSNARPPAFAPAADDSDMPF